jgi:hypothetical protein
MQRIIRIWFLILGLAVLSAAGNDNQPHAMLMNLQVTVSAP